MLVTCASRAKTAESIEMMVGLESHRSKEPCIMWGTYGRHLAYVTEQSLLGGDVGYRYHHCNNLLSVVVAVKFIFLPIASLYAVLTAYLNQSTDRTIVANRLIN